MGFRSCVVSVGPSAFLSDYAKLHAKKSSNKCTKLSSMCRRTGCVMSSVQYIFQRSNSSQQTVSIGYCRCMFEHLRLVNNLTPRLHSSFSSCIQKPRSGFLHSTLILFSTTRSCATCRVANTRSEVAERRRLGGPASAAMPTRPPISRVLGRVFVGC